MKKWILLLKKHYRKYQTEQPSDSWINCLTYTVHLCYTLGLLILSRFYLRKASTGMDVMCRRKPSLYIRGHLAIGNGSRLWSTIQRTRLAVFDRATLSIGTNTFINGARIAAKNKISIGDNVHIAPEVIIMDSDFHDIVDHHSDGQSKEIIIHNKVWIATRAMILKGVTVGEGAVIAAGSVVTKNVAPYTVVGGTPARFIKQLQHN